MVVMRCPSAWTASTVQLFTARPSMSTVQAPHWLVSQPICVPVRFELIPQHVNQQRASARPAPVRAAPLMVSVTDRFMDTGLLDSGRRDARVTRLWP